MKQIYFLLILIFISLIISVNSADPDPEDVDTIDDQYHEIFDSNFYTIDGSDQEYIVVEDDDGELHVYEFNYGKSDEVTDQDIIDAILQYREWGGEENTCPSPHEEEYAPELAYLEFFSPSGRSLLKGAPSTGDIHLLGGMTYPPFCTEEGTYKVRFFHNKDYRLQKSVYSINWDADKVACDCLGQQTEKTTDWTEATTNHCCGDDIPFDSGSLGGAYLCATSTSGVYKWYHVSSSQRAGDVFNVPYGNFDIVSDGSDWYACDSKNDGTGSFTGTVKTIGEPVDSLHSYLCYTNGELEQFAECKGSDRSTYNANLAGGFGKSFATGSGIQIGPEIYYCSNDKKWHSDLDLTDKISCEAAGFEWTGSLCCGDDIQDTFNDKGGEAGCFKSNKTDSNTLHNNQIMNLDGNYYSCQLSEQERKSIVDTQHGGILINNSQNQDSCDVKGYYFCTPQGEWNKDSEGAPSSVSRNKFKSIPETEDTPLGDIKDSCCPGDYCWNGHACIPNEATATEARNPFRGEKTYRCIDGTWNETFEQCTWDNSDCSHFCPSKTQCMVDVNGIPANNNNPETYKGTLNTENPQCIETGQYIGDYYCNNTIWTTRTKLIALQLLNLVEERGDIDEYVLFCDHYTKTLNDYDYYDVEDRLGGNPVAVPPFDTYRSCSDDYEVPCANNFCTLKYKENSDEKIVFGTSLNQPINADTLSFLGTLDKTKDFCNPLINTNLDFKKCGGDENIWYSDKLNSVIFSEQGLNFESLTTWESFIKFLKHPLNSIMLAFGTPGIELDYSYTSKTKDYNRIYIQRFDEKSVKGITEKPDPIKNPFLAINFTGFTSDICKSINNYQKAHPARLYGATNCTKTGDSYYVISDQDTVLEIWPDFTSKLRLN